MCCGFELEEVVGRTGRRTDSPMNPSEGRPVPMRDGHREQAETFPLEEPACRTLAGQPQCAWLVSCAWYTLRGEACCPGTRWGRGSLAGSAGKSSLGPGLQQEKAPPRGCQGWRAQHPGALRERASHHRHREPPVPSCVPSLKGRAALSAFRKGGCLTATEEPFPALCPGTHG